MFPISKPNTHSANLSLLPLRLWPRIWLLQLQCWLRPELLLHWHSQSRSGLSLFSLNWLYIGNWGKAKPWNCTTRFAHIVHDTIWQWYAGGFSHPSGSQGRLLNMPRHYSVCVCLCECTSVCVCGWKFTYGNRRFSLRAAFPCLATVREANRMPIRLCAGKAKTKLIWSINIRYSM